MSIEYFDLKERHVFVRAWTEYVPSPDPFTLVFIIDNTILLGTCWNNKLEGAEADVYGFFESLLTACYYFLQPEHPHVQKITKFDRENAEKDGFELKDEVVVYQVSERSGMYYFCSNGKTARIYYHNELLEFTDCPEFKGRHRGVVELPLKEFIEDVLKISREYLEKYAPVIEEVLHEHGIWSDDYDFLQKFYREVKELYEKRFGSETHREQSG
ncbi:hypothetical protein [Thermococcus gammatolerans]|uniref:Uncharacterized protein n=1 Tax=Thermococcus gammatolerans (strain DSM 15229 / JCM 11827 / EJ3) TaxID=593117 RepID=C5A578_THEGJ|nr:hypothetical protein [Thermococcus gammatolerans]ACS33390.1 Conserved hypothetical protein [Thermococcus gammatolerans EJ3]